MRMRGFEASAEILTNLAIIIGAIDMYNNVNDNEAMPAANAKELETPGERMSYVLFDELLLERLQREK